MVVGLLLSVLNMLVVMISGMVNCMMLMLRLLRLVFRVSVLFFFVFGKKNEMFDIEEVKLLLLKLYSSVSISKMI